MRASEVGQHQTGAWERDRGHRVYKANCPESIHEHKRFKGSRGSAVGVCQELTMGLQVEP